MWKNLTNALLAPHYNIIYHCSLQTISLVRSNVLNYQTAKLKLYCIISQTDYQTGSLVISTYTVDTFTKCSYFCQTPIVLLIACIFLIKCLHS